MGELDLYCFRHAESHRQLDEHLIGGRSNESPLTTWGFLQAGLLGMRLRREGVKFDEVYSSIAVRAVQTAETACVEAGFLDKIVQCEELQELSEGDWEGQPRALIHTPEMLARINRAPYGTHRPPGGESQLDGEQRICGFVNELIARSSEKRTVGLFTHGFTIKCLFRGLMESSPERTYKIVIDNTSITRFKHTSRGWHLLSLNDAGHLIGLPRAGDRYSGQ